MRDWRLMDLRSAYKPVRYFHCKRCRDGDALQIIRKCMTNSGSISKLRIKSNAAPEIKRFLSI